MWWFNVSFPYAMASPKVSIEGTFTYFVVMTPDHRLHLVECPRDAIQGWLHPITTEDKLAYFRTLLRVGFDTLDMGSFVSPKAMPAMADTGKVLAQLEEEGIWDQTDTRALVIVANERGARDAVEFESVSDLGFPLSISPTFQERNTHAASMKLRRRLDIVSNLCAKSGKELWFTSAWDSAIPMGTIGMKTCRNGASELQSASPLL